MKHLDELTTDDLAALWIGRICQLDVQNEIALRAAYERLAGLDGLAWAQAPVMLRPLAHGCRQMLKSSEWDDDLVADCLAGIDQIEAAHRRRNRAVHDSWARIDPTNPDAFVKMEMGLRPAKEKTIWYLKDFEACHQRLQVASIIAGSLNMIVADRLEPYLEEFSRLSAREYLRGRFILHEDGSTVTLTDPAVDSKVTAMIWAYVAEQERIAAEDLVAPDPFDEGDDQFPVA
jgi:hypothetical protein